MRTLAAACLLVWLLPTASVAGTVELSHSNDLFAGSREDDDLYTAALGVAVERGRWRIALLENLFTDRAAGLRFDETYLSAATGLLAATSPWSLRVEFGAVHRGRGIFGQGTQNFIHELIDEPEVRLPYLPGSSLHPFLEIEAARNVPLGERWTLRPTLELGSAGFREHARAQLETAWRLPHRLRTVAAAGWHGADTELAPLVPWLSASAETWTLGLEYGELVSLRWTENAYGTEDRHLHLRLRFPFGGTRRRGD